MKIFTSLLAFLCVAACSINIADPAGEGEGEGDVGEGEGDAGEGEGDAGEGEGDVGEGEGEGERDPGPGQCRGGVDCDNGMLCFSPNDPPRCGIPPPESDCVDNGNCDFDLVCDVRFQCGVVLTCVSVCSANNPCLDGETCVAGRCESNSCNDGFACPAHMVCGARGSPLDADADTHDCDFQACITDADCPADIVCVENLCAPSYGSCSFPPP
jgi:hypothetical protein